MESNMKRKTFSVESYDSADGCRCLLGRFGSRDEALAKVKEDMAECASDYTYFDESGETVGPIVYDEDAFYVESHDGSAHRMWAISEAPDGWPGDGEPE
jgi:hypothetical protein